LPDTDGVEWLTLRRINKELRPPDIPPISLKLPGKYTMMYEQHKEAAMRTLWEETGIRVNPKDVFPTGHIVPSDPQFWWRPTIRYFIAEVPFDVVVDGPQINAASYMSGWDSRVLRQSPDPIDRAWAQYANPETGCAWLKWPLINELQKPLKGDDYMQIRYTPPPFTNLQEVVGLLGGSGEPLESH
jgi:ADP-ribose pyrophosphatase YjhB (NUDIX family)